jgi:predicted DNA-binding transcriptional regulator YafY
VVYHGGAWYTAGYCHLRAAPRVFRLDRVLAVAPLSPGETFARPAGVDVLDLVLRSLASVPRAYAVEVALATDVAQAQGMLPPSLGGAALEATTEGVVLRCRTDSPEWMARVLAGLECDVVVHEPPELRQALRRLAARLQRAAGEASLPG